MGDVRIGRRIILNSVLKKESVTFCAVLILSIWISLERSSERANKHSVFIKLDEDIQ